MTNCGERIACPTSIAGAGSSPSNCGGYGDACTACTAFRDANSAALMIANDRLLATNAALLTVYREGK